MENIFIEQGRDTPKVILDADDALIEFDGKSYPGDAFGFYRPLLEWVENYLANDTQEPININIKLLYFNSATSQILYTLFDLFEEGQENNLNINWYCEEGNKDNYEDYEDMAEEFENLKINVIVYS